MGVGRIRHWTSALQFLAERTLKVSVGEIPSQVGSVKISVAIHVLFLYNLFQGLVPAYHHRLAFISTLQRLHEETSSLLYGQHRFSNLFFEQLFPGETFALAVQPVANPALLSDSVGDDEVWSPIAAVVEPVEEIDNISLRDEDVSNHTPVHSPLSKNAERPSQPSDGGNLVVEPVVESSGGEEEGPGEEVEVEVEDSDDGGNTTLEPVEESSEGEEESQEEEVEVEDSHEGWTEDVVEDDVYENSAQLVINQASLKVLDEQEAADARNTEVEAEEAQNTRAEDVSDSEDESQLRDELPRKLAIVVCGGNLPPPPVAPSLFSTNLTATEVL